LSRRLARETAVQVLFQIDIAQGDPARAVEHVAEEFAIPAASKEFALRLVSGTLTNMQQIDNIVQSVSQEWNMARMANVDRNILRLATYELFFCPDIPGNVSVNEAIELAKLYSGEEAGKFVNGILGVLLGKASKQEPDKAGRKLEIPSLPTELELGESAPVVQGDVD
jgi:transcription antitermination protein NusB